MGLADDIRLVCYKSRLSQQKLADAAGISQVAIARFITGDLDVRVEVLESLAAACECRISLRRISRGRPQKPRARNPIWDAVVEIWFPSGVAPGDIRRVGKLARDFRAKGSTAEEIHKRWQRCQAGSPDLMWGPEGFLKQWEQFSDENWERRQAGKRRTKGPGRVQAGTGKYDRPADYSAPG